MYRYPITYLIVLYLIEPKIKDFFIILYLMAP